MRSALLYGTLLIAEALWIFCLWTMLSHLIGQHGPVLGWWPTLAIAAFAFALGLLINPLPNGLALTLQLGFGGASAYLAIALVPWPETVSLAERLTWPLTLVREDFSSVTVASAVLAGFGAALAWRRGIRHTAEPPDQPRVLFVFKLGLAVVCVAALAQWACGCELYALPTGTAFLGLALTALAVERLAPDANLGRDWTNTLLRAAAAVAIGTILLGFVGAHFGNPALSVLGDLWRTVITALIKVLTFLLAPILKGLFWLVEWLRAQLPGGQTTDGISRIEAPRPIEWTQLAPLDGWGSSFFTLLEFLLVGLFFFLLVRVLFQSRRRTMDPPWSDARIERERIVTASDESETGFLRRWLGEFLPQWLRTDPERQDENEPLRPGAVALYFRTLREGRQRGHLWRASDTPNERQGALAQLMPWAPVREITALFNAVRFGAHPNQSAESERLAKTWGERLRENHSGKSAPADP
ncbi:MAG: DUF4129 domain-containing protein [Pseudomonadota bacterium]